MKKKLSYYHICDHKTSLKYIVWVKIIDFSFMPKIISILNKVNLPWRYLVNLLPQIYQNFVFD